MSLSYIQIFPALKTLRGISVMFWEVASLLSPAPQPASLYTGSLLLRQLLFPFLSAAVCHDTNTSCKGRVPDLGGGGIVCFFLKTHTPSSAALRGPAAACSFSLSSDSVKETQPPRIGGPGLTAWPRGILFIENSHLFSL